MQMSFLGFLMIPVFDIMIKLVSIIEVFLIPFTCSNKKGQPLKERVSSYLKSKIQSLTLMNDYEVNCFK